MILSRIGGDDAAEEASSSGSGPSGLSARSRRRSNPSRLLSELRQLVLEINDLVEPRPEQIA
jgi:hypothetical protein